MCGSSTDIDEDAWKAAVQARPDDDEGEAPPFRPHEVKPEELPAGSTVTWTPTSWDHEDCIPGEGGVFSPNEGHFWEGDGRQTKSATWANRTLRQKSAVQVGGNGSCSGVMLKQKWVLTAAHCVSDDNNNEIDGVFVCRQLGTCIGAANVTLAGGYTGGSGDGGGTDYADDWAIIELEETWVSAGETAIETMDLSYALDDKLDGLTRLHNLAYPIFHPTCDEAPDARLIHNEEFEPIARIQNRKLRLKIDGVPGQSGSPIYYCPVGDDNYCGNGERGKVIAVMAGWNDVWNRFVGPKAADFRGEALAIID